jgi:uncharacterized membrane protein (UPF0127 family)
MSLISTRRRASGEEMRRAEGRERDEPRRASSRGGGFLFVALWLALAFPPLVATTLRACAAEPLQRLEIVSANGPHVFEVELARSPAEREKGLMFRRYMPKNRGMLFDFSSPEPATMWMENTYIPLDMLFIRADGTVARIETNTEPLSRRVIAAGEPVLGVLELNGGVCDDLGIKAGDRVVHPMFKPR